MAADLIPISSSSNIAAVGYDPASKTLSVKFHSGATHDYHEVDPRHYDGMRNAPSAGKYFHANIRHAYKSSKRDAT